MDGWTKLHEKTAESVTLADLLDEEPEAFALFMLMLSKAGVWGRFPAHPKLLKARVAPMSERLSAGRIAQLVPLLVQANLVTSYEVDGIPYLYNTNHFSYNGKQSWHRVGKPEFPHPEGFAIPDSLAKYLRDVAAGKYKGKTVEKELQRLRLVSDESATAPTDDSQGVVPGSSPQADVALETIDVRPQTTDVRNDSTTKGKGLTPPAGDVPPTDPPEDEPPPKPAKQDTPQQAAIRRAWEATGGTGAPGGKGYSGLLKLVQTHGIPKAEAWSAHMAALDPEPPDGAERWAWFCELFRRGMGSRDFEWQKDRASPQHAAGRDLNAMEFTGGVESF